MVSQLKTLRLSVGGILLVLTQVSSATIKG